MFLTSATADKLRGMVSKRPSLARRIFSRDYGVIFSSLNGANQSQAITIPRGYPTLFVGLMASMVGDSSAAPVVRIVDSSGGILFQSQATPLLNVAGPGAFAHSRPFAEAFPFSTFMDERQNMTVEIDFNGYVGEISVLLNGFVLRGT